MNTIKLKININHVTTLHQTRKTLYPNPIQTTLRTKKTKTNQITIHLQKNHQHIINNNLPQLHKKLSIPLNLKITTTTKIQNITLTQHPNHITLIPKKQKKQTTKNNLDITKQINTLKTYITPFLKTNIPINMFINSQPIQIQTNTNINTQTIKLHTKNFTNTKTNKLTQKKLIQLKQKTKLNTKLNLKITTNHNLHYNNTLTILTIPQIIKLNINHTIITHTIFINIKQTIQNILLIINHK